jgi:hypothetical protein
MLWVTWVDVLVSMIGGWGSRGARWTLGERSGMDARFERSGLERWAPKRG